jgi:hypothetical protein
MALSNITESAANVAFQDVTTPGHVDFQCLSIGLAFGFPIQVFCGSCPQFFKLLALLLLGSCLAFSS